MIKFYDSVEKWQFSFFHPESLCNKRIGFVCNGCEVPHSSSKNFIQNSDQFKKKNVFLKVRAFYSISLNVFYENLSNPKHKSSKLYGHLLWL